MPQRTYIRELRELPRLSPRATPNDLDKAKVPH